MGVSSATRYDDELSILISGDDVNACQRLEGVLSDQFINSNYHRVSSAEQAREFMLREGGYKSAPAPDLTFLLYSGVRDEQIELIHDLCMVLTEKTANTMIVVLTHRTLDDRLPERLRLAGVKLVMHIDDVRAKKQDIMEVIIEGWFRG